MNNIKSVERLLELALSFSLKKESGTKTKYVLRKSALNSYTIKNVNYFGDGHIPEMAPH